MGTPFSQRWSNRNPRPQYGPFLYEDLYVWPSLWSKPLPFSGELPRKRESTLQRISPWKILAGKTDSLKMIS